MSILPSRPIWLRWVARLTGGTGLAYCGLNALGDQWRESGVEGGRMLPLLLLFAVIAYVAAWWRELEGGAALATIAAALGGIVFTFAERQAFALSLAMSLPLFLAGGLFLISVRSLWTQPD